MIRSRTYRLAQIVRRPGGLSDAELVAKADVRLAAIQDQIRRPFDQAIDTLATLAGSAAVDPDEVYRAALMIAELGSVVGHPGVGRAAFLLCEWIDLTRDDATLLSTGVRPHVHAIRALLREAESSGEASTLLAGLERMVQRRSAPLAAPAPS